MEPLLEELINIQMKSTNIDYNDGDFDDKTQKVSDGELLVYGVVVLLTLTLVESLGCEVD